MRAMLLDELALVLVRPLLPADAELAEVMEGDGEADSAIERAIWQ